MIEGVIAATRFLQFAAVFILFGSSLFYLYGFDAASRPLESRVWPRRVLRQASLVAIAALLIWVIATSAQLADDPHASFDPGALSSLLTDTNFGRAAAERLGVLVLTAVAVHLSSVSRRFWVIALLGGGAVASFAWTGHGGEGGGPAREIHRVADVLHLVTGGIWFGALVPLAFLIRDSVRGLSHEETRTTCTALARFSVIGPFVVAALVLTGLINSWFLVGPEGWGALLTTPYGLLLLVKLGLFLLMLGLATANRFVFTSRLATVSTKSAGTKELALALHRLRLNVFVETLLGLLVLGVVAVLGSLEPITSL